MKERSHAKTEHNQAVESKKETLLAHLMALRKLLIQVAVAVIASTILVYSFLRVPLMNFITQPIVDRNIQIIYTAVSEAFSTQFKVSIVAGVVVVSPFLFWAIWGFIRPALYDEEIRLYRVLFFCALFLFLAGVVFCYCCVYNLAINFFLVSG